MTARLPRGPRKNRSPGDRVSPPLTAERLERAALRYLERFAASTASFRRVLMTRVERSAREHGTDRVEGAALVDALIERYQRSGLLNDAQYAEAKAATLRRRGASARAIREHLAVRGIDAELSAAALVSADEAGHANSEHADSEPADSEPADSEHADSEPADSGDETAARALARRRRLGPFRSADQRAEHRARDLASLGRAGFSYEIARRVIDES
ncbi:MAG: RecX family transcriptional regulator [Rhodospirillaceae bacterium]